jgi:hypothetical protein
MIAPAQHEEPLRQKPELCLVTPQHARPLPSRMREKEFLPREGVALISIHRVDLIHNDLMASNANLNPSRGSVAIHEDPPPPNYSRTELPCRF